MNTQENEHELARQRVSALKRRWWLLAGPLIIGALTAGLLSASRPNVYEAHVNILFQTTSLDQLLFGRTVFAEPPSTPTAAINTNIRLLDQLRISELTDKKINLPLGPKELQKKIEVAQQGDSNLVTLTASDSNPELAARIANTWAASFLAFQQAAKRRPLAAAARKLRKRLESLSQSDDVEQTAIAARLTDLETLSQIQTPQAQITQRAATPNEPVSPRPTRDAVLGGTVGLLFGLFLALLIERFDRRLRSPEEFEEAFGLPVLANIPESKALGVAEPGKKALSPADEEAFQGLRAHLRYFDVDRTVRSVLLTSAAPRDGKSTVSWNLARSVGMSGSSAVLLEVDFHKPVFAERYQLEPFPGMSELISGQVSVDRATQRIPIADQSSTSSTDSEASLDVIVAGAPPPNRTELVQSDRFRQLIQELAERYDLVVLDAPPIIVMSDSIPLMQLVDGVVVVGQAGKSTRDEAQRVRKGLHDRIAPLLGVVVNRVRPRDQGYAYYGRAPALPRSMLHVSRRS